MSGNAMEEGLILQIHNPSHLDPSRFGFLAGALSGFAGLVVITTIFPNLPALIATYISLAIVAGVGTFVTVKIIARRTRRAEQRMINRRDMQEAETKRKIAEMKAAMVK